MLVVVRRIRVNVSFIGSVVFVANLVKCVIITTCLAACLYQVQVSAVQYFQYPTVTKVTIQSEYPATLPALSVCHQSASGINAEKFKTLAALLEEDFLKETITYITEPGARVEYFIRLCRACVSVHPVSKESRINDPRNMTLYSLYVESITTTLLEHDRTSFLGFVHDAGRKIYGQYESYFEAFPMSENLISMTSSKFKTRLLLPPHDTDCRDYNDTGFESQHHCIESCAIKHSMDLYGSFPIYVSAAYDALQDPYDTKRNMTRVDHLLDICRSECRQRDCFSTAYSVTYKEYYSRTGEHIRFGFAIEASTEPIHEITSISTIDLISFIIMILGCISFWTGLCPFALFLSEKLILKSIRHFFSSNATPAYMTLIVSISALAYLYQIFIVSSIYFSYETVNRMEFEEKNSLEIPVLDFCHQYKYSADVHNLTMEATLESLKTRSGIEFYTSENMKHGSHPNITMHQYIVFGLLCHSIRISEETSQSQDDRISDVRGKWITDATAGGSMIPVN